MFDATPKLRDLLDVRTIVLVAVIALGAFGLQLLFLARTVAGPLGGAIADFDRVPQVDRAPPEALARQNAHEADPVRDVVVGARLQWHWPAEAEAHARAPECLVYR